VAKKITDEDLELLDELGVDPAPASKSSHTAREQRIIAGFEEIERFVEEHGRAPEHGEGRDIFERIYAVRLDRIRESQECRGVLKGLDKHGLLKDVVAYASASSDLSDAELLATLGVSAQPGNDVRQLVHVRSQEEIRAAEEIAKRSPCEDFEEFRPLFEQVQEELDSGVRKSIKYKDNAEVRKGDLFILDGQKVIVAELGEPFVTDYGRPDRRLRVVYDNGTESDLLVRSLQRALNKDKTSRRITEEGFGPLFGDLEEDGDLSTGYIYVLRSHSDHPFVAEHRTVIHKIGVTGSDVKQRVANAKKDPTYLLADVEIVATYKLANVNPRKLETLLQRFFSRARLDMELKDRFGGQVEPREWFLVPLPAIEDAIARVKDGTLTQFTYNPENACLDLVEADDKTK
jgi:hypothetical protein